jgi:Tol biopolymer transport system component
MGPVISMRNLKTAAVTEVPLELSFVSTFDLSPDGRTIVCLGSDLEQHSGVFTVDTATGAVHLVVPRQEGIARQFEPQFTDSGRSITYVVGDFKGHGVLVERDLTAGSVRTLATLPQAVGNALRRSPDGRSMLTVVGTDSPAATMLRVFDVTSGQIRDLFRVDRADGLSVEDGVQWTPDGRAVVANVRGAGENVRELWWIPIDGTQPHRLDVGVTNVVTGAIAIDPTGQHIAFVAGDPLPSLTTVLHYEFRLLEHFLPAK